MSGKSGSRRRGMGKLDSSLKFDYYYGVEAEQFSFYRVPRLLVKDKRFKGLSSDAKLLYGLMLDRMALSMKNGWLDGENKAYIHYTIENIMEDLGCAKATCAKVLAELDSKKGIGLIEKKRQGLGKPDIIYVKNFVLSEPMMNEEKVVENPIDTNVSTEVQNLNLQKSKKQNSRSSENELQEVQKLDFQKSKKQDSRSSESELQEVQNLNPNYNNTSYTDKSYIYPIYPSEQEAKGTGQEKTMHDRIDEMDNVHAYMELIKKNIAYDYHMKYNQCQDRELYEELYEVICEIVCVKRKTVKVNGEEYPYELVKSKFLKLTSAHLEYVIACMQETTTKITNIRSYMITALYNAPSTMKHYYQQEVMHDMYGDEQAKKEIV